MIRKSMELAGKTLTLETGRMAKQANGSVLVTYGDTMLLVTATVSKEPRQGIDFFPLIVDFNEKMYASGKIPGGFIKREARPSVWATLNARVIDRSIRPYFPDGFRNEVQIVVTTLSFDEECDVGALGIIGASAALQTSEIPFLNYLAGLHVGEVDGEMKVMPTVEETDRATLDLAVAGSETSVVMIEAGAIETSEERMLEAIWYGHGIIKEIIEFQKSFCEEATKEKIEIPLDVVPPEIHEAIEAKFASEIDDAAHTKGKLEREQAFDEVKEKMLETFREELGEEAFEEVEATYKRAFKELVKKHVRKAILEDHYRVDGRGLEDIRQITCEVDVLPRVHGSALFTRGETQALGAVTLGSTSDEKIIDGLSEEYRKTFFLHYNFPPFSVGETGFMRGPGRRELGHGMLAERSLKPMLPDKEDFPYTVRIVSEILESNGSSSMATVCAGSLSMLAAGVPLKKPVAGIANGLIKEGDNFVVLTDIMGLEDHLGDMDFKVAGTRDGITALQMDIKIDGITRDIMAIALKQALAARLFILDRMEETIPVPRKDLSPFAPRIVSFKVDTDKIGEIIGQQGKVIKGIIEKTKVAIDIEDDGTVNIASSDKDGLEQAKKIIDCIVNPPDENEIYEGTVVRTEPYGAFVRFMEGYKEGMVHISNMAGQRVAEVEDLVKVGDSVKVRFLRWERGKIALTMKGIDGNPKLPDDYDGRGHSGGRDNAGGRGSSGGGGGYNRSSGDRRGSRDRGPGHSSGSRDSGSRSRDRNHPRKPRSHEDE